MKVLLISANTERTNILPLPLGPAFVAAATRRAGHEVILLNLMFEGDTQSAIQDCIEEFRPEVIGISVRNIDDQNMAESKVPPATGAGSRGNVPRPVRCSDRRGRGRLQYFPGKRFALSRRRHGNPG